MMMSRNGRVDPVHVGTSVFVVLLGTLQMMMMIGRRQNVIRIGLRRQMCWAIEHY